MGRKKKSIDRGISPDIRFGSVIASKFVKKMMWDGKLSVARRIFYRAMDVVQEKVSKEDPIRVSPKRRESLAIRWIIASARSRPERTMGEKLAQELIDAFNKTGISVKKKEDTHRMAEANRAFAHYRW